LSPLSQLRSQTTNLFLKYQISFFMNGSTQN